MVSSSIAAVLLVAATMTTAHAEPPKTPHEAQPFHSCAQPACHDVRPESTTDRGDDHTPVDIRIHLGHVAIATMEGVWLRRGPTLRNEPIMVSPIVVGDALTIALGGRF
jgi:hypothetical protein